MGIFDFLSRKKPSWDEIDLFQGETAPCPNCGTPLIKQFVYSETFCGECHYGLEDDDDDDASEALSVDDAALIWQSNGMDEDYTFGYTGSELRAALED